MIQDVGRPDPGVVIVIVALPRDQVFDAPARRFEAVVDNGINRKYLTQLGLPDLLGKFRVDDLQLIEGKGLLQDNIVAILESVKTCWSNLVNSVGAQETTLQFFLMK